MKTGQAPKMALAPRVSSAAGAQPARPPRILQTFTRPPSADVREIPKPESLC